MEPEDDDNSNPSTEPTLDTHKSVSETEQGTEAGEGGEVALYEQPLDCKEEVEGSERVEEAEEVIQTENRNADVAEEELRVAAEIESTETRGVGRELAGEVGNEGTEGDADGAEELGDMRNEELVKDESGDDGAAGELENMGEKEEAVDGVGNSEGVGNGGEELSLGQKEDPADEVEESDVNVGVGEDDEEEKVANREGLEHPEEAQTADESKSSENTVAPQGSGDAEMGDADMNDRVAEGDNREEMESAEAVEEKEEVEEAAEEAKLNENMVVTEGSGDAEMGEAEMNDREGERDNGEEMNLAEAEEEKEYVEEAAEEAKLNEKRVVAQGSGDTEMGYEEMDDREGIKDNGEEMKLAEAEEEKEQVEEAAEEAKLNENTVVAQGSGDAQMGYEEMDDRELKRDNRQEMESAEAEEEKEEAEEGEKMKEVEETEIAEEAEEEDSSRSVGGKRKRGKNAKSPAKTPSKKKAEEDVCFICFDGGNLVLCDRRGCPKAYHPSCVNRDEAFFQTKGRWNCGWHLCSNCQKNAHYMCFTCTFSLCKGCIKEAVIFCVRGNKGFCETCMRTVMMIEKSEQGNMETVDFNDKNSWEHLFKDYWMDLKEKLSLTSEELAQAKNPRKGIDLHSGKQGLSEDLHDAHDDGGSGSDSSTGDAEPTASKRRKGSKRLRSRTKGRGSKRKSTLTGDFEDGSIEWASRELIEFVAHMKNGDKSVCSQFDVQALLLEYIKRNKLRDPRKKSQIICDARLESLFGKPRVGHFEMLKLLESHFFLKEDSQGDDLQGSVVVNETNQMETDGSTSVKMSKDKKGKSRKKGRGLQSNLDDFAAIDSHNINLIYLRRSLVENLLDDTETFHVKAVGSFVRIRISGNAQKQDLYRLVQVVGTSKAAEPYKVGKKMTEYVLEILNLSKTEVVSIDIISNQDFTEDECKRLRQSIKCGLINPLTVGDFQEKALALQAVRVEDLLESEVTRLSHLRDRASDMGKRKELRECVEKLQLLKTPEERQRRLDEMPEIHADPNMDPNIESEEDEDEADDKKQESLLRPRGSGFSRRGREPPVSPRKGGFASNDSWSGTKNFSSSNRELSRSMSNKGFSNKADDAIKADEMLNVSLLSHGREREPPVSQSWEKSKAASNSETLVTHSLLTSEMPRGMSEMSPTHPSVEVMQSALKVNESDKIWHYRDPSGKVQGPFSVVQLKKWSNTGYFPNDLRIWRSTEKEDDSILLADALKGNFQKETPPIAKSSLQTRMVPEAHASPSLVGRAGEDWKSQTDISNSAGQAASTAVSGPNKSSSRWGPESSLPSPTPARTPIVATKGQLYESQWSPTPTQSADNGIGANPFSRGSGHLQHRESGHHNTQLHSQSEVPNVSLRGQVNSHPHPAPDSSGGTANVSIDLKSLQNLIQPIASNKPLVGAQGWGPATVSKPEMNPSNSSAWSGSQTWGSTSSHTQESEKTVAQPNPYGNLANVPPFPNSASLSTVNPSGVSPVPAPSSSAPHGLWSAPVPGQSGVPPSIPSNMQWGIAENKSGAQRQGAENQVTGWGAIPANPTAGWGGPASANPNQVWAPPGQGSAPGNTNMGWGAPTQGQVPGNTTNSGWVGPVAAQTPGNAYQNWAPPPAQGSAQMNPNPAWGAPNLGQPPANSTPSWDKGPGDRFSGHRDRGPQGGDSGYGGNKPWSRQSSFGNRGDSSRPPFKGQRICKFHESGHCKKGAQCDYLHT